MSGRERRPEGTNMKTRIGKHRLLHDEAQCAFGSDNLAARSRPVRRSALRFALATMCAFWAFSGMANPQGEAMTIPKPTLNPEFVKWQNSRKPSNRQDASPQSPNARKITFRSLPSPTAPEPEMVSLPEGVVPTMIDFSYLNALNSMNVGSVSGMIPTCHDPRDLTPVRNQDP